MCKLANFRNNSAKKMAFGSLYGGGDGEYNGTEFVDTSKLFTMMDEFIFQTPSFVGVYISSITFWIVHRAITQWDCPGISPSLQPREIPRLSHIM